MSQRLALHLLGPPKLELDNAPIATDRRKTLALLAYLAVNRGPHTRDYLSALLFPDYDQSKAFTNLRHTLWETQQAIGEGWIVADHETIGLIAEGVDHSTPSSGRGIWLDVAQFEALIMESRTQNDISLRIPLLTDSVKLYRNHFLTGFSLKDAPNFNEWAFNESENLRHQLTGALTLLSDDLCAVGQVEIAIPHTQRLIALDPLNEASHRQMMKIYIEAGQPNAALKQYQTYEKILRKELGVDPQPETRAIYKQSRRCELISTQPVKQKGLSALQHNLPFQLSKFIGREIEQSEITSLMANHRLVTLIGTGGIGKTRLSLKVGEQSIKAYANGVWLVELASLNDPALVPQTMAAIFNIAEGSDESFTEKLIRVLRPKTMLLVLDNCEHVLSACTQLADALLKNCPHLKILATSREALGITGEALYHVPPLGLPDVRQILEKLLQYESIQLFEERARLVQEKFSLTLENASSIAQICHRLDGIPLAIELAAARVNVFSTEKIAVRLNQSFNLLTKGNRATLPRHQTLRACIDWSWNLLSESEQIVLRRLSVFAGSWTLEGAEAVVTGAGVNELDVLDLLSNLMEKSLVFVDCETGRYRMLETIRQYASEKFQETDEVGAVRNRHCAWVLAWAEEIEPELEGPDLIAQLPRVAIELDNVRTAVEWGLSTGEPEISMRIVNALYYFWDGHNPFKESRQWLEKGISLRERLSKNTLAEALSKVTWFAFRQNDPAAGLPYAEECLTLSEELEDQILRGNSAKAERYFEKACQHYEKLGDKKGLAFAISDYGVALTYQGNVARAIELFEAHLNLLVDFDDLRSAWFQFALGGFKILQGDLE